MTMIYSMLITHAEISMAVLDLTENGQGGEHAEAGLWKLTG